MDGLIITTGIVDIVGFIFQTDSVIFICVNFAYWAIFSVRFFLAYKSLKFLIKHQRDVRVNICYVYYVIIAKC